jgi:predicted dehydrogenase
MYMTPHHEHPSPNITPSQADNTVRVGLVGYGYAGHSLHAPLIRATPGLRITAVASRHASKVHATLGADVAVCDPQQIARRDDVDLIVLASPNDAHHPGALAALRAGKHVVVDKPFALDAAQAQELIDVAQAGQRLLSVFHNRRWDSDFLTLRHVLAQGRLGRVVEFSAHFDRYRPLVRQRWREGTGPGAGLWLDLGPHLLDQAVQLFGSPSSIRLDQASLRDGAQADDWFEAVLFWSAGPHAGLRARLHASTLAAQPGPRFAVHGTLGSFTVEGLDGQEDVLKTGQRPDTVPAGSWGHETRQARLALASGDGAAPDTLRHEALALLPGDYPAYYAGIRAALLGLGENPVPVDGALLVQQLLDAGRASSAASAATARPAGA